MASIKQIFGSTLAYGIIPKIPTVINIFILPIITPYLTLDDYGIWGIISAYCNFFVCLAPLGLNVHLTNSYFEIKKWKIYWGHIYFLLLISGIVCSVIYICFIMMELRYVPIGMRALIAIISSTPILFFSTNTISGHLYPLLSKPLPLVLRNLIASLCTIAVTFFVVYELRLGYWGWILGSATGSIVSFSMFSITLRKDEKIYPSIERNFRRVKNWFKISMPVIPHTIGFMLLASSSRIIMSLYDVPLKDIGIYSNGYMMGDYVTVVSVALVTALSPEIQRAYRENRLNDFRHIFYICQFTALFFVFLISFWMGDIYKLIMRNPNLQLAVPIASYICYANVLNPLYNFLAVVVFINKNTKHLLWLLFVPGLINVTICLIGIPIFGYMTAVFSTLISYWSMLLVPFISKFHRQQVVRWLGNRVKLLLLFLVLLLTMIISMYIRDTGIIFRIIITLIGFIGISVFLYKKKSILNF